MWFECVTTKNLSRAVGVVWEVPEMLGWYFQGADLQTFDRPDDQGGGDQVVVIRVVGASSGKRQTQHQSGTDEEVFEGYTQGPGLDCRICYSVTESCQTLGDHAAYGTPGSPVLP